MAQPQGWRSRKDSAEAAKMLIQIYNTIGAIPEDLLKAYKKMLKSHKPGVVHSFYETITNECPEMLKYFLK